MAERIPRVWLLLGDRLGDNTQVRTLGAMLGYPSEERYLRYNRLYHLPNQLKGASLISVRHDSLVDLAPPWPDLVIFCGRKSVGTALWIRKQSGGRTRLVAIGRPRARLDLFDLVVTTPQYRLPHAENVVELLIPLSGVTGEALNDGADLWRDEVSELPEPRIAVLVGGDTTTNRFDDVAADRLGRLASQYAKTCRGSLMVTTSPRTGEKAVNALIGAITAPSKIHRWAPGLLKPNPYLGFLGLADEVIVTCDSASMIADAGVAKKQILLFDVPMQPRNVVIGLQHRLYLRLEDQAIRGVAPNWFGRLLLRLASAGVLAPPRNMQRLYKNVVAKGYAYWLVDACVEGKLLRPLRTEVMTRGVEEVISRIRALFEDSDGAKARDASPDVEHMGRSGVA